jgi:hypothetical protein
VRELLLVALNSVSKKSADELLSEEDVLEWLQLEDDDPEIKRE